MAPAAIYLDNNATTTMDPAVARRMYELLLEGLANPASQHRAGRRSLNLLEEAKSRLLESVRAPNSGMEACQVLLTSGGTEANNLAIRGYAGASGMVVIAGTEHPSVLDAARSLGQGRHRILPVDSSGACDLNLLEDWLRLFSSNIRLVSIMLGNNETGIIQDLRKICLLCRQFNVAVHSDAVQAVGKIPLDMLELGLSAMTITAHKLHGPVGIGALILRHGEKVEPLLVGGGQQLGLRPGTEPVVPALALADAVDLCCRSLTEGAYDRVARLRDFFEQSLLALDPLEIVGYHASRLPHVSNIAFHGLDRQALHMALDLASIACSTGSACASGSSLPSHVLTAMGLDSATVGSSMRFSFSRFTTAEEVQTAIERVTQVVQKLRSKQ